MEFIKLEQQVREILVNNPLARKDDFVLVAAVYSNYVDTGISFNSLMINHKSLKLPPFATITRCRRKVQEKDDSLRDYQTAENRVELQKEYRDYAFNNLQ